MKPQDSKDGATGSSKTKEIDLEHASLDDLLARLDTLNQEEKEEKAIAKGGKDSALSTMKTLEGIITKLESDIADGSWITGYYADMDLQWMPKLVEKANSKYPEMKLHFVSTTEDFITLMKKTIRDGIPSSRFITNVGDEKIHFSVIDHRTVNGETSLVLFEPTTFNNQYAAISAVKLKTAFENSQLPHCYFSMVEIDIQRSQSECGIFCLALAKKLHRESNKLCRLHEDNVRGVLGNRDVPLSGEKIDTYLPVTLFKHVQSGRRLRKYFDENPSLLHKSVNKKGEEAFERRAKHLVMKEDKVYSVSVHKKRISEYRSLMR
ncbi:YopJ/AvrA family T3SS effector serine/threonine acetyltransferase [Bartonella sp. B35(2025)]